MPYMKIEDISDNSVSIMSSLAWVSKSRIRKKEGLSYV